ncbi:MAG: ParA family protein [Turicibacter sp.]
MKSIAVFNNKGGVGKTTISTTIGYELARQGKKVLLMDLDPQSNSTQVVLSEEQVERLYDKPIKSIDRIKSIKDVYAPMLDSNEATIGEVNDVILKAKFHKFGFDIIPSSLMLSEFEDTLSDAWSDLRANKLGGLRRTNWFIQLTEQIKGKYDYLILDLSPSLGALNRSVLLNVDTFLIPVTGDIYNVYGVKNIATWIKGWLKIYQRAMNYLEEDYSSDVLDTAKINRKVTEENFNKFIGYIISKARTRGKHRNRHIIEYQDRNLKRIEEVINESLLFTTSEALKNKLKLGTVLEIKSFLTEAEGAHIPAYKQVAREVDYSQGGNSQNHNDDGVWSAKFGMMKSFTEIVANVTKNIEELYE